MPGREPSVNNEFGENRSQLKARLIQEQRWSDYLKRREPLRKALESAHPDWAPKDVAVHAFLALSSDFRPLDPDYVVPSKAAKSKAGEERRRQALSRRNTEVVREAVLPQEREAEARRHLVFHASQQRGRSSSVQADVEWVYRYLGVPWTEIPPDSVPSPGAVVLLETAKQDRLFFFKEYHSKLLPTRQQLERNLWQGVDEERVDELVRGTGVLTDAEQAIVREFE